MQIEVTSKVSKDLYEVSKLAAGLIAALAAKKPLAEVAAQELPALMVAVDGVSNIPADAKESLGASIRAAILPLSDAIEALVAGKQAAPAPQA
jgi:hypothetical protein